MALTICAECNKEVSDRASACPGCGNPIAAPRKSEVDRAVGAVKSFTFIMIWIVVLGGGLIYYGLK